MSTHGITRADIRAVNLPRRRAVNRLVEGFATLAALIAVATLGVVVYEVARRGAPALNLDLLTKDPVPFSIGPVKQGVANAVAGSIVLIGLATLMALPVGILIAIYLNEFAPPPIRAGVSLVLDVLNGVPAIVVGIFVFVLVVVGHGQSGWAGAFALAILMLPLVARSTMEVLSLVPSSLREASLGLGIPRWRTTLSVVLPQSIGGIVTGTVLAVARIAGETAPLLFTSLNNQFWSVNMNAPMANLPVVIFQFALSPYADWQELAWGGAMLITLTILLLNILARALASWSNHTS